MYHPSQGEKSQMQGDQGQILGKYTLGTAANGGGSTERQGRRKEKGWMLERRRTEGGGVVEGIRAADKEWGPGKAMALMTGC